MSTPQDNQQPGYESGGYGGSGYGGSGYRQDRDDANRSLGAGDTPLQPDIHVNPLVENQYQVNPGDTPYTETWANPDPELE